MNGSFSKLALSAVQVCPQSRANLHAAFSKFAQRSAQTCVAMFPNLRSADSKLALGVGHGEGVTQTASSPAFTGIRREAYLRQVIRRRD